MFVHVSGEKNRNNYEKFIRLFHKYCMVAEMSSLFINQAIIKRLVLIENWHTVKEHR